VGFGLSGEGVYSVTAVSSRGGSVDGARLTLALLESEAGRYRQNKLPERSE